MNYFIHQKMASVSMPVLGEGCSSQKNIGQTISDFNWYILLYRIMNSVPKCFRMSSNMNMATIGSERNNTWQG